MSLFFTFQPLPHRNSLYVPHLELFLILPDCDHKCNSLQSLHYLLYHPLDLSEITPVVTAPPGGIFLTHIPTRMTCHPIIFAQCNSFFVSHCVCQPNKRAPRSLHIHTHKVTDIMDITEGDMHMCCVCTAHFTLVWFFKSSSWWFCMHTMLRKILFPAFFKSAFYSVTRRTIFIIYCFLFFFMRKNIFFYPYRFCPNITRMATHFLYRRD